MRQPGQPGQPQMHASGASRGALAPKARPAMEHAPEKDLTRVQLHPARRPRRSGTLEEAIGLDQPRRAPARAAHFRKPLGMPSNL